MAPLLLAVVALARGEVGPEVARLVESALAQMGEHAERRALMEALKRLAAGERNPQALRQGLALDEVDEQALSLAERVVMDERAQALLAAMMHALVAALESAGGGAAGETSGDSGLGEGSRLPP
ncbi:MAG: hypothetical protein RMK65_02360 [Anaerolineae bacterium]|nr:hypothetical protein [Anaerolineae bacterium]